jgi:hypothetical protein
MQIIAQLQIPEDFEFEDNNENGVYAGGPRWMSPSIVSESGEVGGLSS